jgi:hypothetical protein
MLSSSVAACLNLVVCVGAACAQSYLVARQLYLIRNNVTGLQLMAADRHAHGGGGGAGGGGGGDGVVDNPFDKGTWRANVDEFVRECVPSSLSSALPLPLLLFVASLAPLSERLCGAGA